MPSHDSRSSSWTWIEQLAGQLAADRELAEAFERTPGKVAREVGIPPEAIAAVLAALSRPVGPERPGDDDAASPCDS